MKLIDVSNYQPVPDAWTCAALLRAGITGAIVGLQQPDHALQQVSALRTGGITVEDCYIENTPNPMLPNGMKRGWVAVESGGGFYDEAAIDGQLDYLRRNGLEAGIYTSVYMLEYLGLTSAFADKYATVPLWLANYSQRWQDKLPSGAAMVQYSESGRIQGIDYLLDLNYRPDAPRSEYDTVEIRQLDQGESIAALNAAAAAHGLALNDTDGLTVVEVTAGSPVQPPPGGHVYLFTTKG